MSLAAFSSRLRYVLSCFWYSSDIHMQARHWPDYQPVHKDKVGREVLNGIALLPMHSTPLQILKGCAYFH
jgi:hypothetical protein